MKQKPSVHPENELSKFKLNQNYSLTVDAAPKAHPPPDKWTLDNFDSEN